MAQGLTVFFTGQAGLTTVQRKYLRSDKTAISDFYGTVGGDVMNMGGGYYGVNDTPPSDARYIAWTTGEGSPTYKIEGLSVNAIVIEISGLETGQSVGITYYNSLGVIIGSEITAGITEFLTSAIYLKYDTAIPSTAVFVRARLISEILNIQKWWAINRTAGLYNNGNVTIEAVLAAMVTTLQADADLTAMLGDGVNSIAEFNKLDKLLETLQQTNIPMPAILVWDSFETWLNPGRTHERNAVVNCTVFVENASGPEVREATALPIIEQIYAVLIDSQLGIDIGYVQPSRRDMATDVPGAEHITIWNIEFKADFPWQ